jgi:hypothetical protein
MASGSCQQGPLFFVLVFAVLNNNKPICGRVREGTLSTDTDPGID